MLIRKRSFIEIFIPLMLLAFLGQGTRFIDITHLPDFRFVFLFILFFCLFINKKIFTYIENSWWLFFLFAYLLFCIATSLWSEIPVLSFSKSSMFALSVVILISLGCLWVIRYGFRRSLDWVLPIALLTLISGLFGGKADDQINNVMLYGGLSGNPNNFGFLTAIVLPYFLWRCYCVKKNKRLLLLWIVCLVLDVKFLFASFSRSSIANFLCVISFFLLSLPLSKKLLVSFASVCSIILILIIMPVSLIESLALNHILKGQGTQIQKVATNQILYSREEAWKQSIANATQGGLLGAGFSVTIGDMNYKLGKFYGREKGNSQLAILEETGIVGLLLSSLVVVSLFVYAVRFYSIMHGDEKVMMGLTLGSLSGLLVESFVEAWWDSLGPEVIYFWMLVGVIFGMIYTHKKNHTISLK